MCDFSIWEWRERAKDKKKGIFFLHLFLFAPTLLLHLGGLAVDLRGVHHDGGGAPGAGAPPRRREPAEAGRPRAHPSLLRILN